MRVITSKASLLLLALAGCLRTSTDAAVLAPLASQLTPGGFEQGNQPENIIFGDQLTATVFKNLKRDNRYRIVSGDTRLVCPSKAAEGIQGYLLRVRVDKLMSDTAVATMERTCGGSPGTIVTGEHILLVRRAGEWTIGKIIDGFTMFAM